MQLRRRHKELPPDNHEPEETTSMPARPYRVLHADLPFYSDSKCEKEVQGARLVVLRCEDPAQKQKTIECMPVVKNYRQGQIVSWDLNNKRLWELSWYRNPDTGEPERAWTQAVEFTGKVVKVTEEGA
jgi:hypothetical protein